MEYAQLESRISFLDSEYRREKADLAQLRHKLELSEAEKAEMEKRIGELETELLEVKALSPKVTMLEGIIERFKGEMLTALEDQRLKQKQSLKDAERSRSIEMEVQTRAIKEVRQEVERNRNLDELITLARAETERQAAVLISFQQRLDNLAVQTDEHVRSVSYLEDQRRTDAKHINELKADTTDTFKKLALQVSKVELLEQQIPQFGRFQSELEKVKEGVRAEIERIQYQQAQVDRGVKRWENLSETMQRRLDEYETRMERYAEHYQRNLKALEALQGFQEQMKRDQHEFMELHRLNSDRQKNQLEEWQATYEQAARKRMLESERKQDEMLRQVEKLQAEMKALAVQISPFEEQFTLMLQIAEEDALSRAIAARDWQVRFEQLATGESERVGR
ncbi:MAG TPA: hypothetical protein G4N96_07300 [Chloroflexi bacterium]|nr:hypothetical protein [Chloroflexota bacterium]